MWQRILFILCVSVSAISIHFVLRFRTFQFLESTTTQKKSQQPSGEETLLGLTGDDANFAKKKLSNGYRIALVGDSIMRYQYVSLALYLHTGRWPSNEDKPTMMLYKEFKGWHAYFQASREALSPFEQCNCNRVMNGNLPDMEKSYENRYYLEGNHSLTYITKAGLHPAVGHWDASHVHKKHENLTSSNSLRWSYNWTGLICEYLTHLDPKPDYVVLNAGRWGHDLNETHVQDSIINALKETGMVGIYKTTTASKHEQTEEQFAPSGAHDAPMCDLFIANGHFCLHMNWTLGLSKREYFDTLHLRPNANKVTNLRLLELIKLIKNNEVYAE